MGVPRREYTAEGSVRYTLHSPPFSDRCVLEAILGLAGSWERFCELLAVEGPGFTGVAKQFKQMYRVLLRQQQFDAPARTELPLIDDGIVRPALDERAAPKAMPVGDALPLNGCDGRPAEPSRHVEGSAVYQERPMTAPHDVGGEPTTWHDGSDLTYACCGARYERRRWTCCGPQSSTFNGLPPQSEVWLARFCAPPEEGGCGKCPRYCQCDRTRFPTRQDLMTRRTPQ
jgi:hypothetical protein